MLKKKDDALTPLFIASMKGNVEIVRLLLDNAADVNAKTTDGVTPLWIASMKGNVEIVRLLLDNAADVNAKVSRNGVSYTPLKIAKKFNKTEVVKLLESAKAKE